MFQILHILCCSLLLIARANAALQDLLVGTKVITPEEIEFWDLKSENDYQLDTHPNKAWLVKELIVLHRYNKALDILEKFPPDGPYYKAFARQFQFMAGHSVDPDKIEEGLETGPKSLLSLAVMKDKIIEMHKDDTIDKLGQREVDQLLKLKIER